MAAIIFLLIFVLVSISNLINGGLIMNVNTGIKQAVILAIGIIVLGFCVKSGLESVIAKDRKVVVKGLAEKEVEADKVTWPIVSKEIGNDLPELYQKINATTSTIRQFLLANGVKASEINVNAPVVIGHGISSPKAIRSMILSTERCITADLTAKLQRAFKN